MYEGTQFTQIYTGIQHFSQNCSANAICTTLLQADLTLTSQDKQPFFYGFFEYGEMLDSTEAAHASEDVQSPLANKKLQFVFNGLTGFHFPVCHCPIVGMNMRQLRQLIGEVTTALMNHGFQVLDYRILKCSCCTVLF